LHENARPHVTHSSMQDQLNVTWWEVLKCPTCSPDIFESSKLSKAACLCLMVQCSKVWYRAFGSSPTNSLQVGYVNISAFHHGVVVHQWDSYLNVCGDFVCFWIFYILSEKTESTSMSSLFRKNGQLTTSNRKSAPL
jgi:hypothetical protein